MRTLMENGFLKDITFDQTWKASGLSSDMADYFDPAVSVIVGQKLFS